MIKFHNQIPTRIFYHLQDGQFMYDTISFVVFGSHAIEFGPDTLHIVGLNPNVGQKMVPVRWERYIMVNLIFFSFKIDWKTKEVKYPESQWQLPKA